MWLLYVTAARLGGGGMFDQCGYYMSLLQDLVEEACLISVVTICRCCKTWWRRQFDHVVVAAVSCLISVVTICRCCKTWWRRHV